MQDRSTERGESAISGDALSAARAAYIAGSAEESIEILKVAAAAGDERVLTQLGELLLEVGNDAAAATAFEQARKAGQVVQLSSFGLALERCQQPERAERIYREGVAAGEADSVINLGTLLSSLHRFEEAESLLSSGLLADPQANWQYGDVLQEMKRFAQAVTAYREAIHAGENRAARELALLLDDQPSLREAQDPGFEDLMKSAINAGSLVAEADLADYLLDQDRQTEALGLCREAVRGGNNLLLLTLGNILAENDETLEEAVSVYRSSLAWGESDAKYNLALALYAIGERDEARQLHVEAIEEGDELARENWPFQE